VRTAHPAFPAPSMFCERDKCLASLGRIAPREYERMSEIRTLILRAIGSSQ
jgi:hypothetical protein